jgi:predicted RNase H-like HicB family nuclease
MATYIALIRKETDSDYGVEFPDFPGCVTAGRTLDEARRMAAEALSLHIDGMIADREPIPAPGSLDAIMGNVHNREAVVCLIDAPAMATKAVRINVMLPEDVLRAIDRVTTNRSRFLSDAARAKLHDAA